MARILRQPARACKVIAMAEHLTREQVELVLRRAAELERGHVAGEALVSAEELTRIADEVGLAPDAIRRALHEVRTGTLVPPASPTVLDRVLGPAQWIIERAVPGPVG